MPHTVNRLRQLRQAKSLRLQDLAWLVKVTTGRPVSAATISRLERGIVDTSPHSLAAIARTLQVSPEELWEGVEVK